MNKQCKACGATVPGDANFCQTCGSSDFIIDDYEKTAVLNENENLFQNTMSATNPNQNIQHNTRQQSEQPKKKNKGLIIGIVATVVLVLAFIGNMMEKVFQEQGYGQGDDTITGNDIIVDYDDSYVDIAETEDEQENGINYTKGEFDGTTYINEWADIKFTLPSDFIDGDVSLYEASENDTTDCGAYYMSEDTLSLISIVYEELPTLISYDEESYLDVAMSQMKGQLESFSYEFSSDYSTENIAGNTYVSADGSFNNGYGDFVHSFYVRKLDNYMIGISVMGVSIEANDALVQTIENVN